MVPLFKILTKKETRINEGGRLILVSLFLIL